MSEHFFHDEQWLKRDRVYALEEGNGRVLVRWGSPRAQGEESLSWRKFHHPRTKPGGLWKDFWDEGTWRLSESGEVARSAIAERAPVPLPHNPAAESRGDWLALCAKAQVALQTRHVKKLVPARLSSFEVSPEERLEIARAIPARLFASPLVATYRFLVKSRNSIFFGATPELLFRRERGKLFVPAIAGTRALSGGVPESELRDELFASAKEREEHQVVVEGILESLRKAGLDPKAPPVPQVSKVPGLLHLYTPVEAADLPSLTSEKLLEALHPTPAICGYPKAEAWQWLLEHEPWDRGLYSAPLLFRFPRRELCLVAIRSALLTQTDLHLFAGAGFVSQSDPESEWGETEKKIQVTKRLLFGGSP